MVKKVNMKINYLGIISAFTCITLSMLCESCEDKRSQEKIAQLENDKAQLETLKAKMEKEKRKAEQEKFNNQIGPIITTQRLLQEYRSRLNRNPANTQTSPQPSTPQWENYGNVELWTYSEIDMFSHDKGYQLRRTGEGTVYVCHTEYGDKYELRYINNGRRYSYHVSRGNFTIETDDGVMQFNAHAGSHYFDM